MRQLVVHHGQRGIPSNLRHQGLNFKLWATFGIDGPDFNDLERRAAAVWGVDKVRVTHCRGVTSLVYSIRWWHGWWRRRIADLLMREFAVTAQAHNPDVTEFVLRFETYARHLQLPALYYIWVGDHATPVGGHWNLSGTKPQAS